ncbi:MAG: hypothetical protein DRQ55_11705, partial [Planctomycetota bacterium]
MLALRSLMLLLTALLGLVPAAARAADLTLSPSGASCGGETCCCEGPDDGTEPAPTVAAPTPCPCSEPTPTPAPAPHSPTLPRTPRGADDAPLADASHVDAGQAVLAQPQG